MRPHPPNKKNVPSVNRNAGNTTTSRRNFSSEMVPSGSSVTASSSYSSVGASGGSGDGSHDVNGVHKRGGNVSIQTHHHHSSSSSTSTSTSASSGGATATTGSFPSHQRLITEHYHRYRADAGRQAEASAHVARLSFTQQRDLAMQYIVRTSLRQLEKMLSRKRFELFVSNRGMRRRQQEKEDKKFMTSSSSSSTSFSSSDHSSLHPSSTTQQLLSGQQKQHQNPSPSSSLYNTTTTAESLLLTPTTEEREKVVVAPPTTTTTTTMTPSQLYHSRKQMLLCPYNHTQYKKKFFNSGGGDGSGGSSHFPPPAPAVSNANANVNNESSGSLSAKSTLSETSVQQQHQTPPSRRNTTTDNDDSIMMMMMNPSNGEKRRQKETTTTTSLLSSLSSVTASAPTHTTQGPSGPLLSDVSGVREYFLARDVLREIADCEDRVSMSYRAAVNETLGHLGTGTEELSIIRIVTQAVDQTLYMAAERTAAAQIKEHQVKMRRAKIMQNFAHYPTVAASLRGGIGGTSWVDVAPTQPEGGVPDTGVVGETASGSVVGLDASVVAGNRHRGGWKDHTGSSSLSSSSYLSLFSSNSRLKKTMSPPKRRTGSEAKKQSSWNGSRRSGRSNSKISSGGGSGSGRRQSGRRGGLGTKDVDGDAAAVENDKDDDDDEGHHYHDDEVNSSGSPDDIDSDDSMMYDYDGLQYGYGNPTDDYGGGDGHGRNRGNATNMSSDSGRMSTTAVLSHVLDTCRTLHVPNVPPAMAILPFYSRREVE